MKNKTSKLSLDQFKQQLGSAEISMELISGSILGTCHDDPPKKIELQAGGPPMST